MKNKMSDIVSKMPHPSWLNPTPLQKLHSPIFEQYGVEVWIKRDDLNHAIIQGNKWHKLHPNLQRAKQLGKTQLLSFGGAYSNHIDALSGAAILEGFEAIGIIRGEELAQHPHKWSPTLQRARQRGMRLHFVSRAEYRQRHDPNWIAQWQQTYPNAYILEEGGSNELAVSGFAPLVKDIEQQMQQQSAQNWTHLLCAVGTGASFSGLARYAHEQQNVLGIAVLKDSNYLRPKIEQWINGENTTSKIEATLEATRGRANWQFLTQFHGGGYGKSNEDLMFKIKEFENEFNVLLDPVYTGKVIVAFYQLLQDGFFAPNSRIVLYHSGGLQGRATAQDV